jgi:hypothetical protein
MQPVNFISSIESSYGALGYSALVKPFTGKPERKTLYYLRNAEGFTQQVLILDAKESF